MIVESNHEGVSVIRIVTDSTASIPKDVADQHDIDVVSLHLHWKGVEYEDSSMDVDSFYEDIYEMITDIPTSSQPSLASIECIFEEAAEEGDDVIGVFMSSSMSGTMNCALNAARSVASRYKKFNFRIIDAMSNSFDEAFPVLAAVEGRDAGYTLDECCDRVKNAIASSRFLFTPESLRFLKAGGLYAGIAQVPQSRWAHRKSFRSFRAHLEDLSDSNSHGWRNDDVRQSENSSQSGILDDQEIQIRYREIWFEERHRPLHRII